MIGIKRLLARRKNQTDVPTPTATSSSTTQAPIPDENANLDPPPYSSATQPDQNVAPHAMIYQEPTLPQGLLDPNLNFTAAQMEQQWRAKDRIFARAIVHFIAERFDGNLKGWAGYKYTYICEVSSQILYYVLGS